MRRVDVGILKKTFNKKILIDDEGKEYEIKYFKDSWDALYVVTLLGSRWVFIPMQRVHKYKWKETGIVCKDSDFLEVKRV